MTPFKPGDRVAVYIRTQNDQVKRRVGVVDIIYPNGFMLIEFGNDAYAYPMRHCRRLKPGTKRRRVWVSRKYLEGDCGSNSGLSRSGPIDDDSVEFLEVRRKK